MAVRHAHLLSFRMTREEGRHSNRLEESTWLFDNLEFRLIRVYRWCGTSAQCARRTGRPSVKNDSHAGAAGLCPTAVTAGILLVPVGSRGGTGGAART